MIQPHRRAVIMLAVIVVLAVAALVAAGLLAASESEQSGLAAMNDRSQQRANAWSGAQAVAALLAAQRTAILDGDAPEMPDELLLYDADGAEAVARLLPLGPEGELLVPEMAKLSLRALSAEQLARTGTLAQGAAEAALARRDGSDALEVLVMPEAGAPVTAVLGPAASSIADGMRRMVSGASTGAARPLAVADVVTPFGAQRALGSAMGAPAPRIPLAEEWSDEALRAVDAASQPGIAQQLRDALNGRAPADDGELVRALRLAKIPPAQWSAIMDAVVPGGEAIESGQVDLSHASEAVLRAITGIDDALAARLVQERASLDALARTQRAWPVVQGVMTPEQFEALASAFCARSWLWRARIATGTVDRVRGDGQLRGVQVLEVVIDLGEEPPRFASIRDCTLLPVAAGLAALAAQDGSADEPVDDSKEALSSKDALISDDARESDDAFGSTSALASNPASAPATAPAPSPAAPPASSTPTTADVPAPPRQWRTLADREAEDRQHRTWESLADREKKARDDRAHEWRSLADDEAQRRAKRDNTDRAERAKAWKSSGWPGAGASGGGQKGLPAPLASDALLGRSVEESSVDASSERASGMGSQQPPSVTAPTGGLSGRWRRRGG